MRPSSRSLAFILCLVLGAVVSTACVQPKRLNPDDFKISQARKPLPNPYGVQAAINYDDIPNNSNAVAYDQKLVDTLKKDGSLWPAPPPYIMRDAVGSAAAQDILEANSLSFSLQARNKDDHSFVLPLLNRAMLYIDTGDYMRAFKLLLTAKTVMDSVEQSGGELSAEQGKIFKGEYYEKSLACFYMGFLLYLKGDYQNARAMFMSSLEVDREGLPSEEEIQEYIEDNAKASTKSAAELLAIYESLGDDNRIAHYMLARTLVKLDDQENAEVSLKKTERWNSVPEHLVDEACGSSAQLTKLMDQPPHGENDLDKMEKIESDNLLVLVEMGFAPKKVAEGAEGSQDSLAPRNYPERQAEVYVDGQFIGQTYPLLSMLHQAAGSPRSIKDNVQTGKGVGKTALVTATNFIPIFGGLISSTIKDAWSVVADTRRWGTAPGEIQVFSGHVTPGLHTVTVLFYDRAGNPLPHYEQTHYYVPTKNGGDPTVLITRALRDKGNAINSFYCSKVLSYDAKGETLRFRSSDLMPEVGAKLSVITIEFDDPTVTQRFIDTGYIVQNPYIGPDENAQKQRMASSFPNMRIKKVAVAKVVDGGLNADCKLVQGQLEKGQTYFVTSYDFPFNDVTEVSNHYFVRKQDH
ncbi:MAG: hypothetical protein AB7D07_15425 [Desulfovibrionaceae bacterium]